jgi:SAM-dependent methyltransferase
MIVKSPGIEKLLKEEKIENVLCPICEAEGKKQNDKILATYGYPSVNFQNVICKDCGLIRINPRMTLSGYDKFYKELFFEYLDPYGRPAYVEEIENTVDDTKDTPTKRNEIPYLLPITKEGGRVLDIGAGFGQMLYLLRKHKNILPTGIEPDPESRKIAKEKMGLDLSHETIEEFFKNSNEVFDLVIMEQVFEHLLSPLWTLKEIKKRLAPDGYVYIGVPHGSHPTHPYSLHFQLAHTYNYMPYSFAKLAELSGLKVVALKEPYKHPLKVVLAHKESTYKEEDKEKLEVGKNYKETIRNLKKIKYREFIGYYLKNFVPKKVKIALDKFIGYR